ncbi:hypothetical protein [Devosia sp. CAU 1758]
MITLASPFWGVAGWDFQDFAIPEADIGTLQQLRRLAVLQGEADDVVSADHPDLYKALLPKADIRRLPGVDHEAAGAAPALASVIAEMTNQQA